MRLLNFILNDIFFLEKKDLVELVLQTNGDVSGGVPGGGVHGPGQGGGGPPTTDHNRPRVPASNSWQDNTIRVSDQVRLLFGLL